MGTDKDCLSTVLFEKCPFYLIRESSSFFFVFPLNFTEWEDTVVLDRSSEYFQDILREPEVLRDSKCQQIVRKALDYFQMSYENKLKYWTQNTKPSRWPQLLAALSYAEVRFHGSDWGLQISYLNSRDWVLYWVHSLRSDHRELVYKQRREVRVCGGGWSDEGKQQYRSIFELEL